MLRFDSTRLSQIFLFLNNPPIFGIWQIIMGVRFRKYSRPTFSRLTLWEHRTMQLCSGWQPTQPKVPQHSTQGSSALNPELHATLDSNMRPWFKNTSAYSTSTCLSHTNMLCVCVCVWATHKHTHMAHTHTHTYTCCVCVCVCVGVLVFLKRVEGPPYASSLKFL